MSDGKPVSAAACANCGTSLTDRFCAHCGQDAQAALSIRHFAGEFLEGMFHLDSTFWRSFLPLLLRPGLLTGDYLEGRRKSYAPPLRSYLVLSLVYFLIASVVTTTGTRVVGPTGQAIETKNCAQVAAEATWLRHLVPDVKASCERALTDDRHAFSNALQGLLPKVMFAVLPLVALAQYALGRRQRPLYVESLIFILHFQSFYFLAGTLGLLLVAAVDALVSPFGWASQVVGDALDVVLYAWSACYLFVANRHVYRAGVFKAGLNVAAIAVAYAVFWAAGVALAALYEFTRA
ncbi:MAG TPA: DUF3667 domain-containing protein [Steroidobacteraceae bacterium]|nr:DUF3667 domain-containing protein [Steroidobacteraceae bacterium]